MTVVFAWTMYLYLLKMVTGNMIQLNIVVEIVNMKLWRGREAATNITRHTARPS